MSLHPQICGLWDGCHIWSQWIGAPGETFLFQWRVKLPAAADWGPWNPVRRKGGLNNAWLKLPLWRRGYQVQARVSLWKDGQPAESDWELAQEVTFSKSTCRFSVASESRDYQLFRGSRIHAIVDGASCSYELLDDVAVAAGETVEVECKALVSSGYSQLDFESHFSIRPTLGVTIANSAPSENDTAPTGRDFTVIDALPVTGLRAIFGRADVQ